MADILKELASKIPWCKKRMFELHSWVVESVTLALHDKDHPITQKELAEKMGIDPASQIRRGNREKNSSNQVGRETRNSRQSF
jgi:hypothetical protein